MLTRIDGSNAQSMTCPIPSGRAKRRHKCEWPDVDAADGGSVPSETPWCSFVADVRGTFASIKLLAFPNLNKHAVLRGRVVGITAGRRDDGDITFNVVPDPGYRYMLYHKGQKRPYVVKGRTGERYEAIHNEVQWFNQGKLMPQIEEIRRLVRAGYQPRVETQGKWTYDWVHEGWVEMHPVRGIKVLGAR